jgi:Fe-S cluster assembly ATPase SufC
VQACSGARVYIIHDEINQPACGQVPVISQRVADAANRLAAGRHCHIEIVIVTHAYRLGTQADDVRVEIAQRGSVVHGDIDPANLACLLTHSAIASKRSKK